MANFKRTRTGGSMLFLMGLFYLAAEIVKGDHWEDWSAWSECSRTCDGGATYQERKCVRSYQSRHGCDGDRYRYTTCNITPCPPGVVDFRSEQCSAYNNETYGGKLFKWLPYTDRKNPCALYCIAQGTRTVVRLAPKVLDGTRCRDQGFDMCITGKCWRVGCDYGLGSGRKLDLCGVCGGNNSCLKDNRPYKGRYQWRKKGATQCSATCGAGIEVSVFHCYDTIRKRNVHDKRCSRISLPSGKAQSCFRRRCPPAWKISAWQTCSVSCGGGERSRAVRCMDTLKDGRHQWLHDSFCPLPRPALVQPCNPHLCPTWHAGQWSPCSVTCGLGSQTREVVCRHEGDRFCEDKHKPVTERNCTSFPCPKGHRKRAEHDKDIQRLGELGAMETEEFGSIADNIQEDEVKNHDMSSPRYVVSNWSACSVTCGEGLRQRYVRCQVRLKYLQDIIDIPDAECAGTKPLTEEECNKKPCYEDYEWGITGMTPCDRTCLGGTQESIIQCMDKENKTVVKDEYCKRAPFIPKQRKNCNDIPCPQRWRIGDFGVCSTTCGGGLMSREVSCIQETSRPMNNVRVLPDFMCQQPVPQRARQCNTQYCPADWATGFWSECSATCGNGVELRPVVCQRVSRDGTPIDVDDYHCPPTQRPDSERPCNEGECPKVRIKRQSIRFFQLNKMNRVRLVVGTVAALLPGTSIVVSCPVRGASKTSVKWLKNERPLRTTRRSYISNNGKLRIRKSRPERDAANYTCVAGSEQAGLQIVYSDLYALLEEAAVREKYLLGTVADSPSVTNNTSAFHKDPFDRQKRPLHVVIGEWSPCSVTCDGGLQTRLVSCEIITKDYYERFPGKVCRKKGLSLPPASRKCNIHPCVKWTVTQWTPCSVVNCTREGSALQTRSVRCTAERNASYVSDDMCDISLKPLVTQFCENPLCQPVWNTSDWSLCSADCGGEGLQIRMLTCVWEGTGRAAGRACWGLARPQLSRPCRRDDCKRSCRDVSSYCRMIHVMNMCRYAKFKYKCCKTCRRRKRKHLTSRRRRRRRPHH